jgi:hypothetical protein
VDPVQLSTLIAQIEDQLSRIAAVYQTVEARASALRQDEVVTIEGMAYQLHNLYNACEDLLKLVATSFENHIDDQSDWHRGLVQRMSLNIAGVRPALLSSDVLPHLNQLRAFRHFFRHAYNTPLSLPRLQLVLDDARAAHPLLQRDVTAFVTHLRSLL